MNVHSVQQRLKSAGSMTLLSLTLLVAGCGDRSTETTRDSNVIPADGSFSVDSDAARQQSEAAPQLSGGTVPPGSIEPNTTDRTSAPMVAGSQSEGTGSSNMNGGSRRE